MTLQLFIQHFFNALALGSLYGLIAIGYTMVYGILRLINFAHGDIFMLGAYLVFFSTIAYMPAWTAFFLCGAAFFIFYSTFAGVSRTTPFWFWAVLCAFFALAGYYAFFVPRDFTPPWAVAVCFAIAITSACGILVDKIAYRPLREAPRISALISAIGMSYLLENLGVVLFTGLPRAVRQPPLLTEPILWDITSLMNPGGEAVIVRISPIALIVPVIAGILVLGLLWILYRTKPGLAMRSISRDIETTRLMGVKVNRIIALAFMLGSALAAASGIMWALRYPKIEPYMGILPGFKAFIAAVSGGIGSIPGAMLGGALLGCIEVMVPAFYPELSGYRDAFAFVLLIIILLWRPTGLLGKKTEEKI